MDIKNILDEIVDRVVLAENFHDDFHPDHHPLYEPLGKKRKFSDQARLVKKRKYSQKVLFNKKKSIQEGQKDVSYIGQLGNAIYHGGTLLFCASRWSSCSVFSEW